MSLLFAAAAKGSEHLSAGDAVVVAVAIICFTVIFVFLIRS